MTDNELDQLRQNLHRQFRQMMAEDLPVDFSDESSVTERQRFPRG